MPRRKQTAHIKNGRLRKAECHLCGRIAAIHLGSWDPRLSQAVDVRAGFRCFECSVLAKSDGDGIERVSRSKV